MQSIHSLMCWCTLNSIAMHSYNFKDLSDVVQCHVTQWWQPHNMLCVLAAWKMKGNSRLYSLKKEWMRNISSSDVAHKEAHVN